MNATLKNAFFVLGAICILSVIGFVYYPSSSIWHELSVNLAAGIFCTLLTVYLIDRVLHQQEQARIDRFAAVARARLKRPLLRHVSLWTQIYKACAISKPSTLPSRFADLLKAECLQDIILLDGYAKGPSFPEKTWAELVHDGLDEFRSQLEDVVDKFGAFMEADEIELISQCSDSDFIKYMTMFAQSLSVVPRKFQGYSLFLTIDLNNSHARGPYPGLLEHLQAVQDLLQRVIQTEGAITIPEAEWADNIAPAFGSGRLKTTGGPIAATFTGSGPPPF